MNREQTIAGYWTAFGETADNPAAHRELQRRLVLTDLFFLLVFVLDRQDINHDWLYARCREVETAPDGYLDLWGREHRKSTIITFGKTIQDILLDPEITVGLFSFNRPSAKIFLRQVKREFEINEKLRGLFPDILWEHPSRDAPTWSEDSGLIVKRSRNPKEATLEAWGLVDGAPVGRHYKLMVYDDVVTRDSVTNPEMIEKVTEAWGNSLALSMEGGKIRTIGTRWSYNDTYKTILERGAAIERRHPSTVDGTASGAPVLFTPEYLAAIRRGMGPYQFAAQHLLDPAAERDQGFLAEWITHYDPTEATDANPAEINAYIVVDPASSKKVGSDYTVMAVVGLRSDQNYYLLDAVRDRLNLSERAKALFRLHRKWRPTAVGYERYGMMADIEYLHEEQRRQNYRFSIIELGGRLAKEERVRRLIPIFEQGRFLIPDKLWYRTLEGRPIDLTRVIVDELLSFPVSEHDDAVDSISRIMDAEMETFFPAPSQKRIEDRYARRRQSRAQRFGCSHWAA